MGAIILVVVIFFIIGRAAGLFSGAGQSDSETVIESVSDTAASTESQTETGSQTESEETVPVPDLYGRTQEEAQSILRDYGLYLSIQQGENSDVETNQIYDQNPDAGTTVNRGDTIDVWINTREELVVPDVTNYTYDQAPERVQCSRYPDIRH